MVTQQNKAPVDKSRKTANTLLQKTGNFDWPAGCPDHNPIGNIWNIWTILKKPQCRFLGQF